MTLNVSYFISTYAVLLSSLSGPGGKDETIGKAATTLLEASDYQQFRDMMLFTKFVTVMLRWEMGINEPSPQIHWNPAFASASEVKHTNRGRARQAGAGGSSCARQRRAARRRQRGQRAGRDCQQRVSRRRPPAAHKRALASALAASHRPLGGGAAL